MESPSPLIVLPNEVQWQRTMSNIDAFMKKLRISQELRDTHKDIVYFVTSNTSIFRHPARHRCRALFEAIERVFHGDLDRFTTTVNDVLQAITELRGKDIPQLPVCCSEGTFREVTLSRYQVLGLVGAMFFGCLPSQPCPESRPDCDFSFIREEDVEKSCCLLSYFRSITDSTEVISARKEYIRISRGAPSMPENVTGCSKLCDVVICDNGGVEDAHGLLQADFANRYIGGGVLEGGNVQEEIRFAICPELIVTMLLCEVMDDREAIRVDGATRFSNYTGYGYSFKWAGEYDDPTPLGRDSIRDVSLFCVDALPSPGVEQFSGKLIERELRKFYCGVCKYPSEEGNGSLRGIAIGNWGCGVFGGDPQLKFVIQWAATSLAGRPTVQYYRYGEKRLELLEEFIETMRSAEVRLDKFLEMMKSSRILPVNNGESVELSREDVANSLNLPAMYKASYK
ncbi:conserved hypothetical protein [Perkinsus marinus ATCC 50983]|uniref:poly(ADP-ribose) glycohydrolase n=1 Tax=Perkinsus marinus (strain ATCC 50983 / TXsc) TaxID=423536 RepID=C5KC13_PERM5|nr:conserved hypothetical protein [Perkinsus marinus ATCC 50983]EER18044.1 conserved hypothetical protein [Perkinsus marinus ATCC 50983]|eukprot:XP_002786248.1 conserved hypothetical protein [Perkinsus marinus ATCC 50983]